MKKITVFVFTLCVASQIWAQSNSFPPSGSVGIGTASPSELFHVSGSRSRLNNLYLGEIDGSGFDAIQATSSGGMKVVVGGSTRMTLLANGRIGFGTSLPSEMLHVAGGKIYADGTGTSSGFSLNSWLMYQTSLNGFNLRYNTIDILSADTDGNIGIGTTSPSEKLSVNGNILAKKVTVTQLGWSDYVFGEKYKLRSLSSLESFIKQNKHLPEVPSAKEVEENGISVGDNQALLLKKIEELTLYVIAINKTNEALTKRISILERTKK